MKAVRAVTYGSVMAAALAAVFPSHAEVTKQDRVGTPWYVVVPSGALPPQQLTAGPGTLVTKNSVIKDVQLSAAEPSATAGAGVPSSESALAPDRKAVPDMGWIISRTGKPYVNVDWGEIVQFEVRDPNGVERIVRHRFDGMDNVVSFADVDPPSTWAHNIKIYVNQTYNPMHASASE